MGFANLAVKDWGGLVIEADQGAESVRGAAAATADVPVGLRRRMPKFALAAVRCAVGVARPGCELVFASRFGDVTTALNLSEAIVAADLLSPSAFSACVHNAAPGLAAQVLGEHASHTAVSAGAESLQAGLLEAWLRLSSGEAEEVVVLFADQVMPPIYGEFEHEPGTPMVALALRVGLADTESAAALTPGPGRGGALSLMDRLEAGETWVVVPTSILAPAQ
jgi:hypothetical protein